MPNNWIWQAIGIIVLVILVVVCIQWIANGEFPL